MQSQIDRAIAEIKAQLPNAADRGVPVTQRPIQYAYRVGFADTAKTVDMRVHNIEVLIIQPTSRELATESDVGAVMGIADGLADWLHENKPAGMHVHWGGGGIEVATLEGDGQLVASMIIPLSKRVPV